MQRQGQASIEALEAVGEGNLAKKILIDISNPLDFHKHAAIPIYFQYLFFREKIHPRDFQI